MVAKDRYHNCNSICLIPNPIQKCARYPFHEAVFIWKALNMLFGNKNSRSTLRSNNRPEQRTNHGLIGKGIEWEFSSNNEIVVDGFNQVSLQPDPFGILYF